MKDPLVIANFFIEKGNEIGDPITQMKIQKLVYIAHGWYLSLTDKPLIRAKVQAWKFGPVIPEIYQALKKYGNDPVPVSITNESINDQEIVDFLNIIWDLYGKYSASFLSNLTHQKSSPWDLTAQRYGYDVPPNMIIDNEDIKHHYNPIVKKFNDTLKATPA
ncbi:MAG: type II toxin-antitoxin system antitoxin SocA domain-containing protein [Bacteroidota bacterium]